MKRIVIILGLVFIYFSCNPITERIDSYAVHGIDISHHQSFINWDSVAIEEAIHFAFVKATEGQNFQDTLFCYNWDELRRTQIKRGAYHFFRPTVSATLQAQNFIDLVEIREGDLPPVLDVEVSDGVDYKEVVYQIQTWLSTVETHYNITPIIYTNLKFYHKYIAHNFDNYPIWIARYSQYKPLLSYGNSWAFWQYGNRGRVKGIKGDVDLNVFYGDFVALEEMGYSATASYSDAGHCQ